MIFRYRMIGGPYDMHELPGAERPDPMYCFLGLPGGWKSPTPASMFAERATIPPPDREERYDYRLVMIVEEYERRIAVYAFTGYACKVSWF